MPLASNGSDHVTYTSVLCLVVGPSVPSAIRTSPRDHSSQSSLVRPLAYTHHSEQLTSDHHPTWPYNENFMTSWAQPRVGNRTRGCMRSLGWTGLGGQVKTHRIQVETRKSMEYHSPVTRLSWSFPIHCQAGANTNGSTIKRDRERLLLSLRFIGLTAKRIRAGQLVDGAEGDDRR